MKPIKGDITITQVVFFIGAIMTLAAAFYIALFFNSGNTVNISNLLGGLRLG